MKRSLKSETTNRVSLMGDSCQKEECEASEKSKAVRSGWVFEVSGDLLWPKQRGPNPIETGHPAGRVNDVGQAWESKSEAANDAREAIKTGRAMSPTVHAGQA